MQWEAWRGPFPASFTPCACVCVHACMRVCVHSYTCSAPYQPICFSLTSSFICSPSSCSLLSLALALSSSSLWLLSSPPPCSVSLSLPHPPGGGGLWLPELQANGGGLQNTGPGPIAWLPVAMVTQRQGLSVCGEGRRTGSAEEAGSVLLGSLLGLSVGRPPVNVGSGLSGSQLHLGSDCLCWGPAGGRGGVGAGRTGTGRLAPHRGVRVRRE